MINYEDLSDQEKYIDYPEEFTEELRDQYRTGNANKALNRADEVGMDIRDIIS